MMYGRPIRRKIVIDTDAGLDDAQAILMALTSDTVEVVAITTVLGNTEAPQVANNVLRILKVADRLDVGNYFKKKTFFNKHRNFMYIDKVKFVCRKQFIKHRQPITTQYVLNNVIIIKN